jgi:hypothetical protein
MELLDIRMHDGSRHFVSLPESWPWDEFRDYLKVLDGVMVTDHLTDGVTEVWIDFEFRGHKFTVNNQFGEYWFFVDDPCCDEDILNAVVEHSRRFLE